MSQIPETLESILEWAAAYDSQADDNRIEIPVQNQNTQEKVDSILEWAAAYNSQEEVSEEADRVITNIQNDDTTNDEVTQQDSQEDSQDSSIDTEDLQRHFLEMTELRPAEERQMATLNDSQPMEIDDQETLHSAQYICPICEGTFPRSPDQSIISGRFSLCSECSAREYQTKCWMKCSRSFIDNEAIRSTEDPHVCKFCYKRLCGWCISNLVAESDCSEFRYKFCEACSDPRCEMCNAILNTDIEEDYMLACYNCLYGIQCGRCGELFSTPGVNRNYDVPEFCDFCERLSDTDYEDSDLALQESSDSNDEQDVAENAPDSKKLYDHECNVCRVNDVQSVCLPCGHFCCCRVCFKGLIRKECPMCRSSIQDFKIIFFN